MIDLSNGEPATIVGRAVPLKELSPLRERESIFGPQLVPRERVSTRIALLATWCGGVPGQRILGSSSPSLPPTTQPSQKSRPARDTPPVKPR